MTLSDQPFFILRLAENGFLVQEVQARVRRIDNRLPWYTIENLCPTSSVWTPESFEMTFGNQTVSFLVSGFVDSHLHALGLGKRDQEIDLSDVKNPDEIISRLEQKMLQNSQLKILVGFGWDESRLALSALELGNYLESRWTERIPIFLKRHCCHSAFVNKNFRKRINHSELPNWVHDEHMPLFWDALPATSFEESESFFLNAQSKLLAQGITGIGDMSQDEHSTHVIQRLAEKGALLVDVSGVFDVGRTPSIENQGPTEFVSTQLSPYLGRPAKYQIWHAKKYLDGSLGSRSAALSKPYFDDPTNHGVLLEKTDFLVEICRELLMKGFLLSFHALGDAALDQVIEVEKRLQPLLEFRIQAHLQKQGLRIRHRLEHTQVVRDDQIDFFSKSQLWSFHLQPIHRVTDSTFVESRLGQLRLRNEGYRARAFLNNKIQFCLGSDAPIDSPSPLMAIQSANSHLNSSENLSFLEGLWYSTLHSQHVCGFEPQTLAKNSRVLVVRMGQNDKYLSY